MIHIKLIKPGLFQWNKLLILENIYVSDEPVYTIHNGLLKSFS